MNLFFFFPEIGIWTFLKINLSYNLFFSLPGCIFSEMFPFCNCQNEMQFTFMATKCAWYRSPPFAHSCPLRTTYASLVTKSIRLTEGILPFSAPHPFHSSLRTFLPSFKSPWEMSSERTELSVQHFFKIKFNCCGKDCMPTGIINIWKVVVSWGVWKACEVLVCTCTSSFPFCRC